MPRTGRARLTKAAPAARAASAHDARALAARSAAAVARAAVWPGGGGAGPAPSGAELAALAADVSAPRAPPDMWAGAPALRAAACAHVDCLTDLFWASRAHKAKGSALAAARRAARTELAAGLSPRAGSPVRPYVTLNLAAAAADEGLHEEAAELLVGALGALERLLTTAPAASDAPALHYDAAAAAHNLAVQLKAMKRPHLLYRRRALASAWEAERLCAPQPKGAPPRDSAAVAEVARLQALRTPPAALAAICASSLAFFEARLARRCARQQDGQRGGPPNPYEAPSQSTYEAPSQSTMRAFGPNCRPASAPASRRRAARHARDVATAAADAEAAARAAMAGAAAEAAAAAEASRPLPSPRVRRRPPLERSAAAPRAARRVGAKTPLAQRLAGETDDLVALHVRVPVESLHSRHAAALIITRAARRWVAAARARREAEALREWAAAQVLGAAARRAVAIREAMALRATLREWAAADVIGACWRGWHTRRAVRALRARRHRLQAVLSAWQRARLSEKLEQMQDMVASL